MSIELNKESVEQADASSCQGTNCGTTTGDHSSECLAEAAAGQGWELKPGDLCGRDCPIHKILAEQAGGDERAAFELFVRKHCGMPEHIAVNWDAKFTNDAWEGWQARAALAHSTPEVCSECSDTGKVYDESGDGPWSCYACTGNPEVIGYANGDELDNMLDDRTAVLSPGKTSFHTVPVYRLIRAALAQPSPAQAEQAEVERPEVVAYFDRNYPSTGDAFIWANYEGSPYEPVMTVAQHERIVGARWNRAMDLMGEHVARISEKFKAENAKLSEALDECDGDRWKLRSERDAALARVAELEGKLTDWVHEGFRLNEALAVAKAQHSVPDDDTILQIFADNAEHSEQGDEHGYCIVREQHAQAIARKLLAAAPVCRLSRSALTEAQMRRLYENSTETENERLGFEAFARLIRRAEAVHQIAAAPGKEVGHE
ncbi:hypothetical protein QK393_25830 [Pseudomonas aeruginosa]|nr:hypothetical protein [Pseudomonas aeruginosa]